MLENSRILSTYNMVLAAPCTDGCEIHSCNPLYCQRF